MILRLLPLLALLAAASPAWAAPVGALAPAPPSAASPHVAPLTVPMAAHRASYDLTLDTVHGGETVAASGHMTYQVTDACSSWATQQQLTLRTVTRDGGETDLTSDYATLEGKDGHHLAFDMKQRSNGAVVEEIRGEAVTDATGAGRIRYTLPKPATVMLAPGTLFPMAHTEAIIQAAHAGLKSIAPTLFDGTGPDGAQDTYVTILNAHPAPPTPLDRPELAHLGTSQVHVAFFSQAPATITPDYETAMRYYDNGIADELRMDFGGFTMRGALHTLTLPKKSARC